jgi:hypothetical protein
MGKVEVRMDWTSKTGLHWPQNREDLNGAKNTKWGAEQGGFPRHSSPKGFSGA